MRMLKKTYRHFVRLLRLFQASTPETKSRDERGRSSQRALFRLFLSLLFGLLLFGTSSTMAQPTGYQYYKVISIQASQVQGSGTLTNFPVLISITDPDLAANVQNANGYDIVFYDSFNGTQLNHQIERYNSATGELVVWVQVPSLSGSTNTQIYMFYGNASVNSDPSTTATWDNNYVLVQHLNDNLLDATSYNNDATNNGTTNITGIIADGQDFDGNDTYLQIDNDASLDITQQITISAWIYYEGNNGSNQPDLITKGDYTQSYSTWIDSDESLVFPINGNGTNSNGSIATDNWEYVTFTRDAGGRNFYINGSLDNSDNYTNAIQNVNAPLFIATPDYSLDARLDEIRISNTARSADWIATEYNNQSNPVNFYTIGAEQLVDTTPPAAPQNVAATQIAGGDITISFDDVDEAGSGVSSYSVKRANSSVGPYSQIGTVNDNESATYSFTDNTAVGGNTYYYVVTAIDAASNESSNSTEASATSDATAPVFQSAATNVSGTQIILDYNEQLNIGSVPATNDYTVLASGNPQTVNSVSISNDKVTLTLNAAVNGGATLTVSYTAGTNPVEDAAGNNTANLTNQPVTNNADNIPPSLVSITADGNSVILNYDEMLDAGSVPLASDYNVQVNSSARSITNVQISSDRVLLTLNPAVISGDNVQIDYTAGSNPVQDEAGNNVANFTNQTATNNTFNNTGFGPNPCPIDNNHDAGWACFDGTYNSTTMDAYVGDLKIAVIDAAAGSQTQFSPNALQEWGSGAFTGDNYNGPQLNPTGANGNTTSFDINIPAGVRSESIILALNRLTPNGGATTYTLEAFDASNNKLTVNDWLTGQGTDGGVCTNSVNLVYTNGNTTIEFQPTVSGNPACSASSTPIWFRITDSNVSRIEIRKTTSQPDNIYMGLAVAADFGDAPNTYGTKYSSYASAPAFHLLNNDGNNPVFFGTGVDGDGNGRPNPNANGDDNDTGLDSGDDEGGTTTPLPELRVGDTNYSVALTCTNGAAVSGWVDFDRSGTFDFDEYASGTCSSGTVTLTWNNLSGIVQGQSYARFRIASNSSEIQSAVGYASDGEVEDYAITIQEEAQTDLELVKTVDNSTPNEGDTITFTVTITNNGPQTATGVKVTDQFPAGLTYISSSVQQGTYNNSTGIWNMGTIAASGSEVLTITASVNAGTVGQTITNNASVTAFNESDPVLSNNTASSGVTVVPLATDIAVTKTVNNSTPNEGEFITFTITATNNGSNDATNLKIIDQLPSGLSFESASTATGSYNSGTSVWTIGNLTNGNSATLLLQARVDQGTEGNAITNTAAVNSVDQDDNTVSNNSASVNINIIQGGLPQCGVTPELSFTNPTLISGTAGQVGAVYLFQDVRPNVDAEVEIITINNTTLTTFDIDNTGSEANFQPQVALNNGSTKGYIDFEIRFQQANQNNSVFITLATSGVDVDGNSQDVKEYVGFQRLTSFTYDPAGELDPGSEGIYTTFTPQSFANGAGIDVNNTDFLVYTTYTNEPQFRIRAGVISNNNNGSAARWFSFNFDACNVNLFGGNGNSQEIVDVGVTKSVDTINPETGDTINYTVTVFNNKLNTVNNVEVADQLPNGLTFVSSAPSQGNYNNGTGVWNVGSLSGQQQATLTITASVDNGTEGDVITNTATVEVDNNNQIDGNSNNNTASIAISVVDPNATGCTDLPYFSFQNPTIAQGSAGQVGVVYRFSNVRSGLDALVEITAIQNAVLSDIDADGSANSAANFSPLFDSDDNSGGGYIDFKITLVQAGTNIPVKQDFAMSALDIDGTTSGGSSIRDYLGFAANQASTVESGTNLNRTTDPPFEIFESSVAQDANGSFDTNHIAYITYNYTSVLKIRTGSYLQGSYGDRLVDIDFRQCVIDEFDNPVTTTRDADIAVTKTTDNANPLSGETVNFTVTVTNNGPENATELDINETIPNGLTLVQATPSQGTYNQLTDIWAVGTLNNSNSATLQLETTVANDAPESITNKAYVLGLNQFDPTTSNDTAEVNLQVSVPIKGTVFEDVTGDALIDGDTNFGDATGGQRALENVVVYLFKDGGDGVADGSDDTYKQSVTTSSTGAYQINVGNNGTYWIVVDSRSGNLSNGTTWAEQTYAPAGGLCTDGAGTTTTLTSAGNCFGGRRGNQSDAVPNTPAGSDLANAEHVSKVVMSGTQINNIDFGFSFNVVTNVDDGDDDASANRTIQGSLRQFIQNANTITGANVMRFTPAVSTNAPGGGSWWSVTISSDLPAITGDLTTIDGTAYNLSNPSQTLNTNSGSIGSGGTVGIDQLSLPKYEKKELDINLNDQGANAFKINSTGSVTVKNVALFNNNSVLIEISNVSNANIQNNLIGNNASGGLGSLGFGGLSNYGVSLTGTGSNSALINKNSIASLWLEGIKSTNSNATITVTNNEIKNISGGIYITISGVGKWIIKQNLIASNGGTTNEQVAGGSGIELGGTSGSSQNNVIQNNTIRDNAIAGITILNNVSSTLITKNIITGNGTNYSSGTPYGAGIRLTTPNGQPQQGITITQNSFHDNYGLSIDIVKTYSGANAGKADGVNPNDGQLQPASSVPNKGLDYPVFTLATFDGDTLHIEGYVGTFSNHVPGSYSIELYKAFDDGNQDGKIEAMPGSLTRPHGEGKIYIGTITTNTDGTFSEDIISPSLPIALYDRITAVAIDNAGNTSEFSANKRVVPTGVTVSGYVFNDENHNSTKESGEAGLPSVTVVLYNVNENNCKSVLTNSSGYYIFNNVLNGSYKVIEAYGQSIPYPDQCIPATADPANHVSTTPNLRPLVVNNLPATVNFGDFEGSKISGRVFNDNGTGGGTAHDIIFNGSETGIHNTVIKALDNAATVVAQTTAAADGSYTLYIDKSDIQNGSATIKETNLGNYITIGGTAGNTGGSYSKNTDAVTFTNTAGQVYTGVNFADVQKSVLLTDGQLSLLPGTSGLFQHKFIAKTTGTVTFTKVLDNNPGSVAFSVYIYKDSNQNGAIDSGEPILNSSNPLAVTAGQEIHLVVKATVPPGTNAGSTSSITVKATFKLTDTSPLIQQTLTRNDLVTVSEVTGGLSLTKTVDKAQAQPGAIITYTITYTNNGDSPVNSLQIDDTVPSFTTFVQAAYGTLPNNLTQCSIIHPNVGQTGSISWDFTGTLAPGASGTVTFKVKIND